MVYHIPLSRRIRQLAVLAALLLAPSPGAAALAAQAPRAAATYPDTPAGRRLREVVRLIDAPGADAVRAYVRSAYADAFRGFAPMEMHVAYYYRLHDQTRGVELVGIQESTPTKAVALLRARLTGEPIALGVEVEPGAAHRIVRLGQEVPRPLAGASAAPATDAARVRELGAFLDRLGGADVFSGVVVLAKDGEVLLRRAYGEADKDFGVAIDTATRFDLASVGKMFTAVAVAQLVERGRLSWDDPLARYLPDFPTPEAARRIRIAHLVSHTAGLPLFGSKYEAGRTSARSVDAMLAWGAGDTLLFEPGTRWQYSNLGMIALGAVIERVTGQSYYDYVREHVFEPAGMTATAFDELDRVAPRLATGYEKEYADAGTRYRTNLLARMGRGGPAGGAVSTVGDLLRFAAALRAGKLVRPATLALLTTPKPELGSPDYAYGFETYREGVYGHGGTFPGVSASVEIYRETGYVLVVLSNYGGAVAPVLRKAWALLPTADTPVTTTTTTVR